MRASTAATVLYWLIALFTFGYCSTEKEAWQATHCPSNDYPENICATSPGLYGIIAATLWPLYWSWEFQG